jgi:transcriptional regulator with XRE-family HTH domain
MTDRSLISLRLRQARLNAGLNQEEAAAISGISIRTIRRSESKGTNSLSTLLTLCEIYKVSVTEIIDGKKKDLDYLANAIRQLGPNACDVLIALCDAMNEIDN